MTNPDSMTQQRIAEARPTEHGAVAELIDERALASRLGISRSTLQSWRYTGRGPRYLKVGRLIRYRGGDVDAFLTASARGVGVP